LIIEDVTLLKNEQFVNWCDKGIAFSFYALIYFLPISIALCETFTGTALLFYLLKRGAIFGDYLRKKSLEGTKLSFWKRGREFFKAFKPIDNCLNWPIVIFLFFNLISVIFSQFHRESIEGFLGKSLQSAFIYFNFIECMKSEKRLKIFITVFLISCGLICINGLTQFAYGEGFVRHNLISDGRISSSLRAPNDFAAYLVVVVPLLLCLFIMGISRRKQEDAKIPFHSFAPYFRRLKLVAFFIFLIAVICLGLTYSRGAWVGFILSLVMLGATNRKIFLPFALVIIVFLSGFYPQLIKNRPPIHDKRSFSHQNNRLNYWKRGLAIVKDYPIFGSGLNTYSIVSQGYNTGWGGYPHNSYLQMASETGIVGISAFLWMLIVFFQCSFRALRKIKILSQKMLLFGALTGLTGFLIHSFFDTSFYSVQLGSLMWVVMGLVVAIGKIETDDGIIVNA